LDWWVRSGGGTPAGDPRTTGVSPSPATLHTVLRGTHLRTRGKRWWCWSFGGWRCPPPSVPSHTASTRRHRPLCQRRHPPTSAHNTRPPATTDRRHRPSCQRRHPPTISSGPPARRHATPAVNHHPFQRPAFLHPPRFQHTHLTSLRDIPPDSHPTIRSHVASRALHRFARAGRVST
jgi:hypothetical protein